MKRAVWFMAFLLCCSVMLYGQEEEVIGVPKKNIDHTLLPRTAVFAVYPGIWAPGIKTEWAENNKRLSFGLHARGYLFFFNGIRVEPFVRYYFKRNAPHGLYIQTKFSGAVYDANSFMFRGLFCYESATGMLLCPGDPGYVKYDMWRMMAGGGVATGYQFILGRQKRFALDIYCGLQLIFPFNKINSSEELLLWLMRGFPLDTGIRMGWAF